MLYLTNHAVFFATLASIFVLRGMPRLTWLEKYWLELVLVSLLKLMLCLKMIDIESYRI